MFKREYGEQTMLEVERQTTLFCEEFGRIWEKTLSSDDRRKKFLQLVNLFARSSQVVKGTAFQTHITEHIGIKGFEANLLKDLNDLLTRYAGSHMVYFELLKPGLQTSLQANGMVVQLHTSLEMMIFNISQQNVAHFLILSGYLPQFQDDA
jgi:hypothetical protein